MFIKKEEYKSAIVERDKKIKELECDILNRRAEIERKQSEINRLGKLCEELSASITAKTDDCHVGPWCNECIHHRVFYKHEGESYYEAIPSDSKPWCASTKYVTEYSTGRVIYCAKYIHQICPEMEIKV